MSFKIVGKIKGVSFQANSTNWNIILFIPNQEYVLTSDKQKYAIAIDANNTSNTNKVDRLASGNNGKILKSNGSTPTWSDTVPGYTRASGGTETLNTSGYKIVVVSQANAPVSFDANTIYFITEN